MPLIRQSQIEAFERASTEDLIDGMVAHLKGFAPKHAELLGDEGLRAMIDMGITRGGRYALTDRDVVRLYIELMFMLGSDFDTDPQFPWATRALAACRMTGELDCANELYAGLTKYLDAVAGPANSYVLNALRRARQVNFADFSRADSDLDGVVERLRLIHPEKLVYVGRTAVRRLTLEAAGIVSDYALPDTPGTFVFVAMMFALGHGCISDRQFPWVERSLRGGDPARRLERLHSRAMTYLERALSHLELRTDVPSRLQQTDKT